MFRAAFSYGNELIFRKMRPHIAGLARERTGSYRNSGKPDHGAAYFSISMRFVERKPFVSRRYR